MNLVDYMHDGWIGQLGSREFIVETFFLTFYRWTKNGLSTHDYTCMRVC